MLNKLTGALKTPTVSSVIAGFTAELEMLLKKNKQQNKHVII